MTSQRTASWLTLILVLCVCGAPASQHTPTLTPTPTITPTCDLGESSQYPTPPPPPTITPHGACELTGPPDMYCGYTFVRDVDYVGYQEFNEFREYDAVSGAGHTNCNACVEIVKWEQIVTKEACFYFNVSGGGDVSGSMKKFLIELGMWVQLELGGKYCCSWTSSGEYTLNPSCGYQEQLFVRKDYIQCYREYCIGKEYRYNGSIHPTAPPGHECPPADSFYLHLTNAEIVIVEKPIAVTSTMRERRVACDAPAPGMKCCNQMNCPSPTPTEG